MLFIQVNKTVKNIPTKGGKSDIYHVQADKPHLFHQGINLMLSRRG